MLFATNFRIRLLQQPTTTMVQNSVLGSVGKSTKSRPFYGNTNNALEVQNIAFKRGQASHNGGFASMDAEKQREIALQGSKASFGSFELGSGKFKEAGRKGGLTS